MTPDTPLLCGGVVHFSDHLYVLAKKIRPVTPAKAGVQKCLRILDSGFRRNDAVGYPIISDTIVITMRSKDKGKKRVPKV